MDDDDEFGGFEAADPTEAQQQADGGIQAGPSPWAFYPGAGGNNQPDLLAPPGGMSVAVGGAAGVDVVQPTRGHDPLEPNFNNTPPQQQAEGGVRSFSEQVLEPRFGSGRRSDQPVPDGVLDLDLTNRQGTAAGADRAAADALDLELELDLGDVGGAADPGADVAAPLDDGGEPQQVAWPNQGAEADARVEENAGAQGGADAEAMNEELQASQREKSRLQQELEEMVKQRGRLQEDLGRLEQELSEQRDRYAALQEQQSRDLEEMRQAGHQALAVIVEEYKELCKTAVLSQQQACESQVMEVIQRERENYTTLLNKQAEDLEAKMDTERTSLKEYVNDVIMQQTQQAQLDIEEKIKKERTELEAQIKESLQSEKEEYEKLIKEAVQKETEALRTTFAEEQTRLERLHEEERRKLREEVSSAIAAENQRCQECMREAVREERSRGEQLSRDVMAQAQRHVTNYISDHKQRDAVIRKKSLASVELLLSSAQKQLQTFLLSEPTSEDDLQAMNTNPVLQRPEENPGPLENNGTVAGTNSVGEANSLCNNETHPDLKSGAATSSNTDPSKNGLMDGEGDRVVRKKSDS